MKGILSTFLELSSLKIKCSRILHHDFFPHLVIAYTVSLVYSPQRFSLNDEHVRLQTNLFTYLFFGFYASTRETWHFRFLLSLPASPWRACTQNRKETNKSVLYTYNRDNPFLTRQQVAGLFTISGSFRVVKNDGASCVFVSS